jgi:flagella basal body P-ring formation protein FlgA
MMTYQMDFARITKYQVFGRAMIVIMATVALSACYYKANTSAAMVAIRDLPAGVVIQESDLTTVIIPRAATTTDLPGWRSEVIGHKTVREIKKGDIILLSSLQESP